MRRLRRWRGESARRRGRGRGRVLRRKRWRVAHRPILVQRQKNLNRFGGGAVPFGVGSASRRPRRAESGSASPTVVATTADLTWACRGSRWLKRARSPLVSAMITALRAVAQPSPRSRAMSARSCARPTATLLATRSSRPMIGRDELSMETVIRRSHASSNSTPSIDVRMSMRCGG